MINIIYYSKTTLRAADSTLIRLSYSQSFGFTHLAKFFNILDCLHKLLHATILHRIMEIFSVDSHDFFPGSFIFRIFSIFFIV